MDPGGGGGNGAGNGILLSSRLGTVCPPSQDKTRATMAVARFGKRDFRKDGPPQPEIVEMSVLF